MDRRTFFRCLAVLAGSAATKTFPATAMATVRTTVKEKEKIEIQRSPIAGFQYGEGAEVWGLLSVGVPVTLVREPDNRHDARAVRVQWKGRKLGYVPRRENAALCHLMDSGRILEGKIVQLSASDDPWERVQFSVRMVS